VIDDDAMMRSFLREVFLREGFEVEEAENGKVGVDLYRARPADLVVTDLYMPEKDGVEVLRELKLDFPGVKIIAVSGGAGRMKSVNVLSTLQDLGVDRTMPKPFRAKDLVEAAREVIESRAGKEKDGG
jgi:DNA-binding response OmpR family regulator